MIPYLLAIAGGYLIGNSMKETPTFDKGGGLKRFNKYSSKVKFYDIDYDIDDEDLEDLDLPKQLETSLANLDDEISSESEARNYVSMYGADYISDVTGFSVNSFDFDIVYDCLLGKCIFWKL